MTPEDHAAEVTAIAENALAELDAAPEIGDLDRRDLARLLSAIGAAWTAALGSRRTRPSERYRWSEVCVLAQRIADRLDKEIALAEAATMPAPFDGQSLAEMFPTPNPKVFPFPPETT